MNNNELMDRLRRLDACAPALDWLEATGHDLATAWAKCQRGDWMLWLAKNAGIDCSALGYVCAERARQSAIRALRAAGVDVHALEACAPIVDAATAQAAADAVTNAEDAADLRSQASANAWSAVSALVDAVAWAADAADAAWASARTEAWSALAETADSAESATRRDRELAAIADLVRAEITADQIREALEEA